VDAVVIDRLIGSFFDFLCERKVGELVDTAQVMAALDTVSTPERLGRLITRFVAPSRQRLLDRAKASTLLFGVWLPEPVKQAIADYLGRPARIPKKLIDEFVKSEKVREQVRTTMQEAITSAMKPGGSGLRGMIGFGARAAGAAGRGLFGGLGAEVQKQFEERIKDVVDGGVGLVQKRIAERLASEETARSLGKRRRQAFLDLQQRSEKEAGEFLAEAPHALLDGLAPVVIPHNLQRAEVREAVKAEIDAALAELSNQTIGQLLDDLGLRAQIKQGARDKLGPLIAAYVASPHFMKG
jgi:hypothetical protein